MFSTERIQVEALMRFVPVSYTHLTQRKADRQNQGQQIHHKKGDCR